MKVPVPVMALPSVGVAVTVYTDVYKRQVDWGTYAHDVEYRLFLTQLASKLYPQLIMEHAYCMIAYNGSQLPTQDYAGDRFAEDVYKRQVPKQAGCQCSQSR